MGIALLIVACCGVTWASVGQGSRGDEVKQVQQKLKELGLYEGTVDGIAGNKTVAAIKAFQKQKGLKQDGIVGPATAAALGLAAGTSNPVNDNDLYLLARTIHAEARGEPYEGQVAVGAIIMNRVKSPLFPNTVSGVVYQPQAFSVVADGQINMAPNETAIKAAREALNGADPTGGCLYYYNPAKTKSQWILSREVVTTIGKHNFAV